jgi:hypothetical protein
MTSGELRRTLQQQLARQHGIQTIHLSIHRCAELALQYGLKPCDSRAIPLESRDRRATASARD